MTSVTKFEILYQQIVSLNNQLSIVAKEAHDGLKTFVEEFVLSNMGVNIHRLDYIKTTILSFNVKENYISIWQYKISY